MSLSGTAQLKHLKLRKTALEDLEMPVIVKEGYIGNMVLKVPWTSLGSRPTVVEVTDLFLVVGPKDTDEYVPPEEVEDRMFENKIRQLEIADSMGIDDPDLDAGTKSNDEKKVGMIEGMVLKIVDGLQVSVNNIHIRYEDPETMNTIGISLKNAILKSTDENWNLKTSNVGRTIMYKVLVVVMF